MEITEIQVSLTEQNSDRLQAFCSITFDDMFVVRDIKIIEGPNGPFVAMPSRRIMTHCPKCRTKNHLRARYCNECGQSMPRGGQQENSRLYADIAHPINSQSREFIQGRILDAFQQELEASNQPGYQRKLDDDERALSRERRQSNGPHRRQEEVSKTCREENASTPIRKHG